MRSNCLTLNYKKCNYIVFKRKQRALPEITTDLFIGDTKPEKLNSTKYLGILLNEHLSWQLRVNHITRKLSIKVHTIDI